ncbi:phospho-N-acetylmuramoyl-pentapeptide-transferase [Leptolinea sp. HRD-7]|jgi:phospho-N-acetylmuramoyl-pentapeptide-transferase|nr:phospho-N-acetylmuramoyl-pentapeptide-transferase [Leptolinea sp. HRD-7]
MKETSLSLTLTGLAFMMTVIWGGPLIRILHHFRIGKLIRFEGPNSHITKMGTPTMGGWMVIVPVVMVTLLMNASILFGFRIFSTIVLVPLTVLIGYGLLGAIDDWEGIRGERKGQGMRARTKLIIQIIFAIPVAFLLKDVIHAPQMFWPGVYDAFDLGIWYIPIAVFIIVSCSNAVNFTDGLDGLAGLISATAFAAFGGIALLQGQDFIGRFCFTMVGALFGFLWFNVHPAELFMGDSGSLAIGATLGVVALMTGQWLLIPAIAIIPVSEAMSVVLQIFYFRLTKGKRLFKMAPLHHHFELCGWSETQVVQRFWLVSLMFAMAGVAIAMV